MRAAQPSGRPVLRHGHTTVDADHGRIETRDISVSTDVGWLQERHRWPGLEAIGKVTRTRETGDKISTETAYYLFSTPITAERGGEVVRSHWGVENRLHWRLDVTMNEDAARNRYAQNSKKPHGITIISSNSSPYFEMRLPWANPENREKAAADLMEKAGAKPASVVDDLPPFRIRNLPGLRRGMASRPSRFGDW